MFLFCFVLYLSATQNIDIGINACALTLRGASYPSTAQRGTVTNIYAIMPYKDPEEKRAHNKRYKLKNDGVLTVKRLLRTDQRRVTHKTYEKIKNHVDPSYWNHVTVIQPVSTVHASLCVAKARDEHEGAECSHADPLPLPVVASSYDNDAQADVEPMNPILEIRAEAVYIVRLRESVLLHEDVYKVGRTSQSFTKRSTNYPRGSILKIQKSVNDSKIVETVLLRAFSKNFISRPDRGREYFQGNYDMMEATFLDVIRRVGDV